MIKQNKVHYKNKNSSVFFIPPSPTDQHTDP